MTQKEILKEVKKAIYIHDFNYEYNTMHSKFMYYNQNYIFITKCYKELNNENKKEFIKYYNKFAPSKLQMKNI